MNRYITWGIVVGILCFLLAIFIVWWFSRDTYTSQLEKYEQDLSDVFVPTKKEVLDSLLPENTVDTYTERQEQIEVLENIKVDDSIVEQTEVSVSQGTPTQPGIVPPSVTAEQEKRIRNLDYLTQ